MKNSTMSLVNKIQPAQNWLDFLYVPCGTSSCLPGRGDGRQCLPGRQVYFINNRDEQVRLRYFYLLLYPR